MVRQLQGMPTSTRQWELSDFKTWVSSNLNRRFVFSGSQLGGLKTQLAAVMAAKEDQLQSTTHDLLNELQASSAPQKDVENFLQDLQSRLGVTRLHPVAGSPLKAFFIITTPASYSGALSACRAKGGTLAILSDSAEAQKAWEVVRTHNGSLYFVGTKSLPEKFHRLYPDLLSNEMSPSSSPAASCLVINPNTTNHFFIAKCSSHFAALCEKFDLMTPLSSIAVKGFVYYRTYKTHEQAKQTCASIGGSLATISDAKQQTEALNHVRYGGNADAFIDAFKGHDNVWRWGDGNNMTYNKWGPFVSPPEWRCAVMERKDSRRQSYGQWRPVSCSSRRAFLCSVRVIQDIFVRLIDRHAFGKYIYRLSGLGSQRTAKSRCKQLVKIRNDEQLAAAMIAARGVGRVHIGLSDAKKPGKFIWDDQSPVSEDLLQKRMISFEMRGKNHRCVVMDEHGRWLTASCNEKAGYLCEKPYRKNPTKQGNKSPSFEMDVRYIAYFHLLSRSWKLKETFIRASEAPIVKIIRGTRNDVIVSGLRKGSIIVRYRVYSKKNKRYSDFKKIKKAVLAGLVIFYFNGLRIRPAEEQNFNYKAFPDSKSKESSPPYWIAAVIGALVLVFLVIHHSKKRQEANQVAATPNANSNPPPPPTPSQNTNPNPPPPPPPSQNTNPNPPPSEDANPTGETRQPTSNDNGDNPEKNGPPPYSAPLHPLSEPPPSYQEPVPPPYFPPSTPPPAYISNVST